MLRTAFFSARSLASRVDPVTLPVDFWSPAEGTVLAALQATPDGLSAATAMDRLRHFAPNMLAHQRRAAPLMLLVRQFNSPIVLLLLFSAGLSFFLHEAVDAIIILAIVLLSGLLGFWQEHGAAGAVAQLLATVQVQARALRDGQAVDLPIEQIVPGDIVLLTAGGVIPADCRVLSARNLFVDEAALTGETYPVAKEAGVIRADAALAQRSNVLFMGTHVISGTAQALVVHTGQQTEFGAIAARLKLGPAETEFERGLRHFGALLVEVTLLLVLAIFAVNVFFARPVLDSFLFALALAVGLTPQLLPAIVSINLAQGAKRMAAAQVIVKRLAAIENFGSMNVLCTDKTGTLTEGVVRVHAAVRADGQPGERTLLYAYLNAAFESGFTNPIDQAIRAYGAANHCDAALYRKLDEVPYDFIRKRLTILVEDPDGARLLITKGALTDILAVCSTVETRTGDIPQQTAQADILRRYEEFSRSGYRTLGVAYRRFPGGEMPRLTPGDETDLTFLGLLVLNDPPKTGIADLMGQFRDLGVTVKMITGDNRLVAATVAQQVGIESARLLSGHDLRAMSDAALIQQVSTINVFAEIEPNQKERILLALRKAGHVVGYLGDGINDAAALHAADVGISVDTAVDVAKEAADIVLLAKDLGVLARGVAEGRTTFANTLKYVFITTSANFGNMFSMAALSLFLPFLPLLPKQILLNNFLTDFPAMAIASDSVDPEMVARPRRWNVRRIRNFMILFGLQSSIFDFLTFGTLLLWQVPMEQFRTGWFMESALSEVLILLVIRTQRVCVRSMPSRYLLGASLAVAIITSLLPYTPFGPLVSLTALPVPVLLSLVMILVLYGITAEVVKKVYFQTQGFLE